MRIPENLDAWPLWIIKISLLIHQTLQSDTYNPLCPAIKNQTAPSKKVERPLNEDGTSQKSTSDKPFHRDQAANALELGGFNSNVEFLLIKIINNFCARRLNGSPKTIFFVFERASGNQQLVPKDSCLSVIGRKRRFPIDNMSCHRCGPRFDKKTCSPG